ncbi:hypothetical protein H8959_007599 [Pygathrix nigripes]
MPGAGLEHLPCLSTIRAPAPTQRPSTRASEVVCSINVSHYELQVEIGRGFDNLTSVHLARHTPAGTLVTIKVTNLENCNEERLKVLQKAMILSHFFWHPNITTYWTVFSVDSWL